MWEQLGEVSQSGGKWCKVLAKGNVSFIFPTHTKRQGDSWHIESSYSSNPTIFQSPTWAHRSNSMSTSLSSSAPPHGDGATWQWCWVLGADCTICIPSRAICGDLWFHALTVVPRQQRPPLVTLLSPRLCHCHQQSCKRSIGFHKHGEGPY